MNFGVFKVIYNGTSVVGAAVSLKAIYILSLGKFYDK
jgi:hypothetical protein